MMLLTPVDFAEAGGGFVDGERSTALAYGGGAAAPPPPPPPVGWTPPAIATADPGALEVSQVVQASSSSSGCGGRCQDSAPPVTSVGGGPEIGPLLNVTAGGTSSSATPASSAGGLTPERATWVWFGALALILLVLFASQHGRS